MPRRRSDEDALPELPAIDGPPGDDSSGDEDVEGLVGIESPSFIEKDPALSDIDIGLEHEITTLPEEGQQWASDPEADRSLDLDDLDLEIAEPPSGEGSDAPGEEDWVDDPMTRSEDTPLGDEEGDEGPLEELEEEELPLPPREPLDESPDDESDSRA